MLMQVLIHICKAHGAVVLAQSSGVIPAFRNDSSKVVALSKPKKVTVAIDADARGLGAYILKAFAG